MAYPTVNFQPTSSFAGLQPINVASSTQAHVLGTVIRARDVNYGEGEFVYLLGVADTAAGDAVCYNSKTGVTVRAVAAGATSVGAFAVAMAATITGLYGWYQISGSGPINATTTAANTQAFLTATAGQIDDTGSGAISGLTITAVTSAGFATVQLDRPAVNPSDSGVNTGDVTLGAFGSTPAAAGASISGQVLTLQPASLTQPGGVSIAAQTFNGAKTFDDGILSDSVASATAASLTLSSSVADSGTSATKAVIINSTSTLTSAARLLSLKNNGSEVAYISADGGIFAISASIESNFRIFAPYFGNNTTSQPFQLRSFVADGASAVGGFVSTETFSTSGAKLFSFRNNSTEKTFVDKDGNVEVTTVGAGFILKSPDGTRYKIVVANGGALSATAA